MGRTAQQDLELAGIIRRMEAAGEPPENIRLVAQNYDRVRVPTPTPAPDAPKLQAGQTGEKPASLRVLESIVGPLGKLAGADPNAVAEAARQAQPAMGMAGTAIDLGAGAVKGVGQMGGGFLQLVNRLTSDPEVRQKIAEQVAEATPRPAGGAEQVGSAGAHLASFAIPAALGANIARVPLSAGVLPFLRNAAARAALEGGEFGAIRAVQQGSTETLPQDIAMGGALAPLGSATSLAAKGAERVLPALGATTEVMGQMAQHPAVAAALERGAGKVIARGAGAVGGLPFGGMGALAGSVYGPTVAQGVAKGAGGLLGGAGRAMQAKVLTDALATIAEHGPLGAAGQGILKLIRSVGGKQAAQEAEAVAAQAAAKSTSAPEATPDVETLRPAPAAVPRKPYVPEFSPETLGLEPLDAATTMPQVLARRAAPPVEAPGAAIPAESAAVGSQAAQAAPGPIPAPAPTMTEASISALDKRRAQLPIAPSELAAQRGRLAEPVREPWMTDTDFEQAWSAHEAELARVKAKDLMAHAFEAQLKAQEPGAKAATVKAAERAQAKALEAKTLADTLLARFDESGNWNPEYPQWSPASPAHERWMGTAPEPASVAGITPPKGGHVPVGSEVFPRRPGEALPAYTPPAEPGAPPDSLEALLTQTLANAKANPLPKLEPRPVAPASPIRVVPGEGDLAPALRASLKEPPPAPPVEPPPAASPVTILPEGQRAMSGGRSGEAQAPPAEFLGLDTPEKKSAFAQLQRLLAGEPVEAPQAAPRWKPVRRYTNAEEIDPYVSKVTAAIDQEQSNLAKGERLGLRIIMNSEGGLHQTGKRVGDQLRPSRVWDYSGTPTGKVLPGTSVVDASDPKAAFITIGDSPSSGIGYGDKGYQVVLVKGKPVRVRGHELDPGEIVLKDAVVVQDLGPRPGSPKWAPPPSTQAPPVEPPPAASPVTILPEGQRAMPGGRSGTAKSPKWEFKVEDPKALKALEDLLAEQPAKPKGKTRKPRLVLRGGKLYTE